MINDCCEGNAEFAPAYSIVCFIGQGYYGGLRLLHAACNSFTNHCCKAGQLIQFIRPGGFTMTYDTNIPRMVSERRSIF